MKHGLHVTICLAAWLALSGTARAGGDEIFSDGFESPMPPPVVSLDASPLSVVAGTQVLLSWSSVGAQTCGAFASPQVAGWAGGVAPAGTRSVTLPLAGASHTFFLTCVNDVGSTTVQAGPVITTPSPQQPPVSCEDYVASVHGGMPPSDPAFVAFGFAEARAPFETVFGVAPGGASGPGPRPVPAPQLNPSQGRYLAIPFALSQPDQSMRLQWTGSAAPYASGPVSITISPCPGDFRARALGTPDPYLHPMCGTAFPVFAGELSIRPGGVGCPAAPGQPLYINIATHAMTTPDGGVFTCQDAPTCGVGMRVEPQ